MGFAVLTVVAILLAAVVQAQARPRCAAKDAVYRAAGLKAKPLFTVVVTVAIASAAPGLAQEKFWRTVQVPAGATARLGSFSNLKPDCSPGPLPEIKVVTPAKTGVIAVRRRQGKLGPATRCPNADATAQIVSYQAKPTPGQDEVAFQVTLPNGKVVLHTVVISVTEGPGTGRSNDDDQP